MKFILQMSRTLAIAAVAMVIARAAIAVARPHTVSEPLLGRDGSAARSSWSQRARKQVGEQSSRHHRCGIPFSDGSSNGGLRPRNVENALSFNGDSLRPMFAYKVTEADEPHYA
jgi:hypothetical protein